MVSHPFPGFGRPRIASCWSAPEHRKVETVPGFSRRLHPAENRTLYSENRTLFFRFQHLSQGGGMSG